MCADVLDVGRAEALLAGRQRGVRRLLEPEEVGLERVHARGREQHRRVERRRARATPTGRRRWPRCLEERQERSRGSRRRSSRAIVAASDARRRRAAGTAVWPGRGAVERARASVERRRRRSVHGTARRAVAQLDARRPRAAGAVQAQRRAARRRSWRSAARGPTVTVLARGVGRAARRAARRAPPIPRPRRWPTVKRWCAAVAPERRARRRSTMSPGRSRRPPWRARKRRAPGAGEEAEVLRVGLGGDRQAVLGGERAHLAACVSSPSGKRSRASDARRQRGEHVGLVLGRVGGGAQQAVGGARARSGRWPASRRRGGRRARASRRGGRGRCSARTGSASGRRRGRRATGRRRRRGTRRAGRA